MAHLRSSKFYAAFYLYNFKPLFFVSCLVDVSLKKLFFCFSQLNEVLVPNPFNRPRAVFMLEVRGVGGTDPALNNEFSTSFHHFLVVLDDELNKFFPQILSSRMTLITLSYLMPITARLFLVQEKLIFKFQVA